MSKLFAALFCFAFFLTLGAKEAYGSAGTIYESESNNTYSTAALTYDDYDNYGYISTTSDVDWWKVKFNSSGSANFWLGNVPSGCDYDLRLYSSNGTTQLLASTNSSNANELITYNVSANVYYYIKINSYSGSSSSSRYWFRTKIYPNNPTITKNDLKSGTIQFMIPMEQSGYGAIVYARTNVNYNLFVEHRLSGTNREITSVSHYVSARKIDPALGSVGVIAAWTGINYVHNGTTTRHWPSFDGNVLYPTGYVWDNKVDSQGFSFPRTHVIDVNATAYFNCPGATNTPVTYTNNLIIP